MVEVVFSSSACGSLKLAQHVGEGKYNGVIGFILDPGEDAVSETERQAIQHRLEEEARRKWESAVPLGGNPGDVFAFPLALSHGDICGGVFGPTRLEVLGKLWVSPDGEDLAAKQLSRAAADLQTVSDRVQAGEDLRIWYDQSPDDRCGLCWLLSALPPVAGRLILVELPVWGWDDPTAKTIQSCTGWGEVSPEDWWRYLPFQRDAPPVFQTALAQQWRRLQQENAPLRAVVSGRLTGVPADFYDPLIVRSLAGQPDEFHQGAAIGNFLGQYPLGLGDGFVFQRMEVMRTAGWLETVTEAAPKDAFYRRRIRKTAGFPTMVTGQNGD